MLPIDAIERERLDVIHTMLKTARDPKARLLHAPSSRLKRLNISGNNFPKVMDLCCGTGIWLLEMAEEFKDAVFYGYDINRLAPGSLRSNIQINCQVDVESSWESSNIAADFDVIHLQLALGAIKDWNLLYSRIRTHLKPGTGWFESVEIDWTPRFTDDSLRIGDLEAWWNQISLAFQWLGYPISYSQTTKEALQRAGFCDIQNQEYEIPLSSWNTTNSQLYKSGVWCNIAMSAESEGNRGLEAMSLRPFYEINNRQPHDTTQLCGKAMEEASNPDVHAYFKLHVWWARAPHPSEGG